MQVGAGRALESQLLPSQDVAAAMRSIMDFAAVLPGTQAPAPDFYTPARRGSDAIAVRFKLRGGNWAYSISRA